MLKTRVRTLLVVVPLCVIVLALSHLPYVLTCAIAFLSLAGIYEIYSAANLLTSRKQLYVSWLLAVAICFMDIPEYWAILAVVLLAAVIVFSHWMRHLAQFAFAGGKRAAWVSLMIPLFYRALVDIRRKEHGLFFILLVILSSVFTEVAGYFIGRAFGKHHIAPEISPKKTWEGCVGGLAVSVMGGCLYAAAAQAVYGLNVQYGRLCLYLICTSIIGQFGDFAMSTIKRSVHIKDFSQLLPGHGGILDRFDSQLFAAPFTLIFITCIQLLR